MEFEIELEENCSDDIHCRISANLSEGLIIFNVIYQESGEQTSVSTTLERHEAILLASALQTLENGLNILEEYASKRIK